MTCHNCGALYGHFNHCIVSTSRINTKEPPPIRNNHPAVWDLVLADIRDRDQFGQQKYNTRLQPFNGRDVLVDAYQEALDLVVYLRQAIYERDAQSRPPVPQ